MRIPYSLRHCSACYFQSSTAFLVLLSIRNLATKRRLDYSRVLFKFRNLFDVCSFLNMILKPLVTTQMAWAVVVLIIFHIVQAKTPLIKTACCCSWARNSLICNNSSVELEKPIVIYVQACNEQQTIVEIYLWEFSKMPRYEMPFKKCCTQKPSMSLMFAYFLSYQ